MSAEDHIPLAAPLFAGNEDRFRQLVEERADIHDPVVPTPCVVRALDIQLLGDLQLRELRAVLCFRIESTDALDLQGRVVGVGDGLVRFWRRHLGLGPPAVHELGGLQQGDEEGYRQACARTIERFGKTTAPSTA